MVDVIGTALEQVGFHLQMHDATDIAAFATYVRDPTAVSIGFDARESLIDVRLHPVALGRVNVRRAVMLSEVSDSGTREDLVVAPAGVSRAQLEWIRDRLLVDAQDLLRGDWTRARMFIRG